MTTAEHLNRIATKCRELLDGDDCKSVYAESGWRATIAAIGGLLSRGKAGELELADELLLDIIIASWPQELLK